MKGLPESPSADGGPNSPRSPQPAFQCAVSADLIRRALLVASDEPTRYYLRGVHVSPHPDGGAYIVGTDGWALACFWDEKAVVTGSAIVAPDAAMRAALAAQRGDKGPRILFARKDRLLLAAVSTDSADEILERPNTHVIAAQFAEPVIDGAYPDWKKLFRQPEPEGKLPILNARLLKRLGAALNAAGTIRPLNLQPTGKGDDAPVLVFGSLKNGVGVLAGIRQSANVLRELPAWLPKEIK